MNGVVGSVSGGDQEVGIQKIFIALMDVLDCDWVHVMDKDPVMNLIALDPKVATVITDDYLVPNMLPLSGSVESLVQPSIIAKG